MGLMRLSAIWNSSRSPRPCGNQVMQQFFDIGQTISSISYLEQPVMRSSIITQHQPTSRRNGKIPPQLGQ